MTIDVDIQLACDEQALFQSGEKMALQINIWVRAVLESLQVSWQRPQSWDAPVSFHLAAQLTVRIVDTDEAKALNQNYRQSAGATNVLSFPFDDPFQCQPPLLGDVVICAPRVAEEARQQGKSELAHWAHLVLHGVLHLLGYDHLDDEQAKLMEDLEASMLAQWGYPDPYKERLVAIK